jgi:hypothetical protein
VVSYTLRTHRFDWALRHSCSVPLSDVSGCSKLRE